MEDLVRQAKELSVMKVQETGQRLPVLQQQQLFSQPRDRDDVTIRQTPSPSQSPRLISRQQLPLVQTQYPQSSISNVTYDQQQQVQPRILGLSAQSGTQISYANNFGTSSAQGNVQSNRPAVEGQGSGFGNSDSQNSANGGRTPSKGQEHAYDTVDNDDVAAEGSTSIYGQFGGWHTVNSARTERNANGQQPSPLHKGTNEAPQLISSQQDQEVQAQASSPMPPQALPGLVRYTPEQAASQFITPAVPAPQNTQSGAAQEELQAQTSHKAAAQRGVSDRDKELIAEISTLRAQVSEQHCVISDLNDMLSSQSARERRNRDVPDRSSNTEVSHFLHCCSGCCFGSLLCGFLCLRVGCVLSVLCCLPSSWAILLFCHCLLFLLVACSPFDAVCSHLGCRFLPASLSISIFDGLFSI